MLTKYRCKSLLSNCYAANQWKRSARRLDELSRFATLFGHMSIGGPRAVDDYEETMRRRLLVKPRTPGQ